MKAVFLLLPALVVSAPAYALSIVSLHGGMTAPFSASSVDMGIVVGCVLALAAAIGFRVIRH
jgi:hypothetical protein